jgi:CubicO group peptidase (beta-lactamase class C family)
MTQITIRKRIVRTLVFVILVAVLSLAAWMAIAGPGTVLRILRYGDTDIDDFSHYPGRELQASQTPFQFNPSDLEMQLPAAAFDAHASYDHLDTLLEENDSIAFLVIQGETLFYERHFQGHTPSSLSQTFSMSKSTTSILIGMAIDDGLIENVDQSIVDFIPELASAGFGDVSFHHLLTMTSGSNYVENDNPFGEHVILNFTPELEKRILEIEIEHGPGELFRYKSGDNALLALALDRALGKETITDYAQRRLWEPLGMQDQGVWTIDHEGDGLEKTWCCLATSARDFAKFGRLLLQDGTWNGNQVISSNWIEQATQQNQVSEALWPDDYRAVGWRGYGYQWWLASEESGDYFALGKDGQFLYINPVRDLIIVRLGWSPGGLRSSEWISLFQTIAEEFS